MPRTYTQSKDAPAEAQLASAARTASGTGTAFDSGDIDTLLGTLTVSAHAGTTPTLDVRVGVDDRGHHAVVHVQDRRGGNLAVVSSIATTAELRAWANVEAGTSLRE